MAQSNVYSLNVVGYYNLPFNAHQKLLIANQLNTTNNTIGSILTTLPAGSLLFKFNGGFSTYTWDFDDNGNLAWDDGTATLNPGEGAFLQPQAATTVTFVGEVLQGSLTNTMPTNAKYIRSSMVPQAGLVTTTLGLPADPGDLLFTFNGGYSTFTYDFDDNGNPAWDTEPNIAVGQSFFFKKGPTGTTTKWIRNFTVQ